MKALSVDRIRHLYEELYSINKGYPNLSAFDRDVTQALQELLQIKQANKEKRKNLTALDRAVDSLNKQTGIKVNLANLAPLWSGDPPGSLVSNLLPNYKYTATCPRCGTVIKDFLPFKKRACQSCAGERISILLNSE